MKPLTNIESFLQRFDNFKDGEIRSIEIVTPINIIITLVGQDKSRDFDWISMKLEFNGTDDARLLDKSKLSLIDMSDGINITSTNNNYVFGLGSSIKGLKNSSCFVSCKNIRYEEGLF